MKKVNLSRIHVIIKNAIADASAMLDELLRCNTIQNMKIFERTTEDDLKAFVKGCATFREEYDDKVRDLEKKERYIEYLKTILDEANRKHGITLLLLKASCIERKLQRLKGMKSMLKIAADIPYMDELKPADYYKSAFTEDNRIYTLEASILNKRDLLDVDKEYAATVQELRDLQDQTATINQSRYVTIKEYSEFA